MEVLPEPSMPSISTFSAWWEAEAPMETLKSAYRVALFLASAVCFCDAEHLEQCMTPKKSLATAIVRHQAVRRTAAETVVCPAHSSATRRCVRVVEYAAHL